MVYRQSPINHPRHSRTLGPQRHLCLDDSREYLKGHIQDTSLHACRVNSRHFHSNSDKPQENGHVSLWRQHLALLHALCTSGELFGLSSKIYCRAHCVTGSSLGWGLRRQFSVSMSAKLSTWLDWSWIVTGGMPVHNAFQKHTEPNKVESRPWWGSSHGLCLIATDLPESKSWKQWSQTRESCQFFSVSDFVTILCLKAQFITTQQHT